MTVAGWSRPSAIHRGSTLLIPPTRAEPAGCCRVVRYTERCYVCVAVRQRTIPNPRRLRCSRGILLFALLLLAVAVSSCTQKRKDFDIAKTAVSRELRSPDTARFCTVGEAEFSIKNGNHTVKLWVDNRNLAGVLVRTHFEVTIDPDSGLVTGATCLECAAEDEKQKLNEAMTDLQALTSPSRPNPTNPAQQEKLQSQSQPSH